MKPFGDFFVIMRESCCAFLGVNNREFFDFCFETFASKQESNIGIVFSNITNEAKRIMSNGLAMSLGVTGNLDPDFPGLFDKKDRIYKTFLLDLDNARQGWYRFEKMGQGDDTTIISYSMLMGVAVLLCALSTAQDVYSEVYERFEDGKYASDELIDWLCDVINYRDSYYIGKIKTEKKYMLPFLLSSLFYCRKWQREGEKPDFNIVLWLDDCFNSLTKISNDEIVAAFQKEYYSMLWNICKTLDIRDMVSGAKLSSISENARISKLYIIPPFLRDNEAVDHPIDDSSLFSYIVVSNTGCGKSTFLQAIVTANIYEKVLALNLSSITDEEQKRYQAIKEQFGFNENYFPIFVKADTVNQINIDDILSTDLLHLAIGSECDSFVDNVRYISEHPENGHILLLVDALDEIDGNQRKEFFGRIIEKFMNETPQTSIILTSRAIDFRDFHGRSFYDNHIRISLGLFGNEEIKELISKWMSCDVSLAADADVEKKYRYFIENAYLSRLASNPYMLSHALRYQAYHTNATPQEIISHVIDNLIVKRWPSEKYQKLGITPKYMREILSCIAWNMAYEDDHIIPANSIVSWFYSASKEVDEDIEIDHKIWDQVIKDMTARSGLIILNELDYVFQNEVIEHYLASEWLISNYSNKWSQDQNEEVYVLIKLQETIRSSLEDNCWEDILSMLFSPDKKYVRVRLDKLTPALFKFLLLKASETMNTKEIKVIGNIFLNVVRNTFGKNHITNDAYESGKEARRQIARFLYNNSHIVGDEWKKDIDFSEALNYIKENKIINEIGE